MKHRRSTPRKFGLVVSDEAMLDFSHLTSAERLKWLDETRHFLSKVMTPERQRIWTAARDLLNKKAKV